MKDYKKIKTTIWKNRDQLEWGLDPDPEGSDRGNFTFYIKDFPEVRVQITSRNYFLKLFGVKHDDFVQDFEVIRKLVFMLTQLYPNGIHFKLDKISYGDSDKDDIMEKKEGQVELLSDLIQKSLTSQKIFHDYIDEIWGTIKNDFKLRKTFIEYANNYFTKAICENGFHCKPDGSIKVDHRNMSPVNIILDLILLSLMEDMRVEEQSYPLAKYYFDYI